MTRHENNIKRRAAIVKSFDAPERREAASTASEGFGGVIARNLNETHRRRFSGLVRDCRARGGRYFPGGYGPSDAQGARS